MDEKGRFGELSTQEMLEIVDKTVPETTKKFASLLIFHSTVRTVVHLSCDHEIISFWRPEVTSLSDRFLDFNDFNEALRASLAIYHLISNARSWNNS